MPHIIITGGSSGIGLEVAKIYLGRGYRVSLIARRRGMLLTAARALTGADLGAGGGVFIASADVSDERELREAIIAAEANHGPCDILVASAGRVDPQEFDAQSAGIFEAQLSVNFLGCVNAVRTVLNGMKKRASGHIMLVSSGAALIGIPGYSAYCASKSALSSFGESLRIEVANAGVTVGVSFPPDTLTPQYEREIPLRPQAARHLMGAVAPWPADQVARKIVIGIDRGTAQVHFGASLTLLWWFSAFIKPVLYRRLQRMQA
ncbi:SDR family oxidoreductase [Agrobacterium tumefaciens]|jgi:3-dehydrosphinganine reductase|uniref:SDR family oxidoreductase n=1 Tax=Agrobacterium tumefaciens TaxID=358 RepID=UPI0015747732|nr:SDR family oxidoreductase [Agrobacterium tumefaciens]